MCAFLSDLCACSACSPSFYFPLYVCASVYVCVCVLGFCLVLGFGLVPSFLLRGNGMKIRYMSPLENLNFIN